MITIDDNKKINATAYHVIFQQVLKDCILDSISGDAYITNDELHSILGMKCRIKPKYQNMVINDLIVLGYIRKDHKQHYTMNKVKVKELEDEA